MSHRVRQILFYVFVAAFGAIGPFVVLYARGFRFDMARKRFVPTGGLYIRSAPAGAAIYIDGVKQGETAGAISEALTKPGLITNLLPREYEVRVEREGYYPWVKRLQVFPRRVTEARGIALFPDPIKPKAVFFTPLWEATASRDGSLVAIVTKEEGRERLGVLDVAGKQFTQILEQKKRVGSAERIFRVLDIAPSGKLLLISEETSRRIVVSVLAVDAGETRRFDLPSGFRRVTESGKQLTVLLSNARGAFSAISEWKWQKDSNGVFLRAGDSLLFWDFRGGTLAEVQSLVLAFEVLSDGILVIRGNPPMLERLSTDGGSIVEGLATEPLPADMSGARLFALGSGPYLILGRGGDESADVLSVAEKNQRPRILDRGVISAIESPDGSRLLVRKSNELWVYYLKDIASEPKHRGGDKQLVLRLGTSLRDAMWHPTSSDYLLYGDTRGFFVVELDDRGGSRNTVELLPRGDGVAPVSVNAKEVLLLVRDRLWRLPLEEEKTPDGSTAPIPVDAAPGSPSA